MIFMFQFIEPLIHFLERQINFFISLKTYSEFCPKNGNTAEIISSSSILQFSNYFLFSKLKSELHGKNLLVKKK